jgi:hypothetical protein
LYISFGKKQPWKEKQKPKAIRNNRGLNTFIDTPRKGNEFSAFSTYQMHAGFCVFSFSVPTSSNFLSLSGRTIPSRKKKRSENGKKIPVYYLAVKFDGVFGRCS